MRPEVEIRRRRDELREVLAMPMLVDLMLNQQQKNELLFMGSHEILLSWVLGESDQSEGPFQGVSEGLHGWKSRN